MSRLLESLEDLIAFFELGGWVLVAIFAVTVVMWTLIVERLIYMRRGHPHRATLALRSFASRSDLRSWYAEQVRAQTVSIVCQSLRRSLPTIKTLVALCPLLGLLGTVTGMIEVFDVMAVAGTGNPRAMASGVSQATIPTMAGMVAAVPGLYFSARLTRIADSKSRLFEDAMGQLR